MFPASVQPTELSQLEWEPYPTSWSMKSVKAGIAWAVLYMYNWMGNPGVAAFRGHNPQWISIVDETIERVGLKNNPARGACRVPEEW